MLLFDGLLLVVVLALARVEGAFAFVGAVQCLLVVPFASVMSQYMAREEATLELAPISAAKLDGEES